MFRSAIAAYYQSNHFFIRINIYKHTKYKIDTTGSMELHSNPVAITHKQLTENI